jgi:hypothetical protein
MRGLIFIALACAGCLRTTEFKCSDDSSCSATGAVCESTQYCSFTDSSCANGRRYGALSGPYANKCVGEGGDGGMDTPDGTAGACPTGYNTLPNAGTHKYKITAGTSLWTTQRDRCAADATASGAVIYLAIPDDANELTAITTLSTAVKTWVGINDIVTEGTYMTTKNAAATFLPWNTAAGEPNDPGNPPQDCVAALMSGPLIEDDKCGDTYAAVCECE